MASVRPGAVLAVGVLVLSLSLAAVSCREPVSADLDRPFDLGIGKTVRVSDLDLTFRRVAGDSRCPQGVVCVWAGEATATLEAGLQNGQPESFDVRLPGGAQGRDSIPATVYDGYRIRMLGLAPAPVAGTPVDTTAYVVTLLVRRR